ncbi:MAG: helix-turn-helix transcriptional regulator [Sphingomonadales bacterium]|nr:helix-turn-helix transcriptional regulator [Sphingomonadales bacterium]
MAEPSLILPDLIEALLAGVTETPPWRGFVERLRGALRADYASVTFRPFARGGAPAGAGDELGPPSRVVHIASGREWPPLFARMYRQSGHVEDPLPYFELVEGRVYALPELLRAGEPAHDAYRARMLEPAGMNRMRMMRLAEPSGVSAWLTVTREQADFGRGEEAMLAALAPFVRPALAAYVALERERTAARVAGEAIRRLNFAWLTLDGEGRVLDTDAQGAELLAQARILRRGRDGRLSAGDRAVARAIGEAVGALDGAETRPRAIVLSREPWLDMLLVPASPAPGTARPAHALIAYVHADSWSSADRCEQLGQLFDLLPSEARLALALARGMSISEAAGDLGITVESARTYSKRIYAKTGARGQADLVRFVHRSVLGIA